MKTMITAIIVITKQNTDRENRKNIDFIDNVKALSSASLASRTAGLPEIPKKTSLGECK